MKKLHGVTAAMVTPFDEKGRVITDAACEMVDFLVERNVDCLYPCGTTGEMFLMSEDDRKIMAETVIRQNRGRATVYIHVGAMDEDETIRLAKHACDSGADGIGIVTPAFFGTNPDAMVAYYQRVLHSVPKDFPAYLYNIPQCSGNDLTCQAVRRIIETCQNVVGIKYSLSDMCRTYEYLSIGNGFEVVQGSDSLFLPCLAMGCAGTVSGVSSVYPEPFVRVYDMWKQGKIEECREAQLLANKFVKALGAGSNMALFKAGLNFRGINGGHMHKPQVDLTEQQAGELCAGLTILENECPEGLLKK